MLPDSTDRILAKLGDEDRVLDVGGWGAPFNRATHVIDAMPYETRGVMGSYGPLEEHFTASSWERRDFCAREPWPYEDGYFDFALCVTTLEDIRDPIWVCAEMSRVARAGYIEVPTPIAELLRRVDDGGPWLGHEHHRWLCFLDHETQAVTFMHKPHSIHFAPSLRVSSRWARGMGLDDHLQGLFWEGSLVATERLELGTRAPLAELAKLVRDRFRPSLPRRVVDSLYAYCQGRIRVWQSDRMRARISAASSESLGPSKNSHFNPPRPGRGA